MTLDELWTQAYEGEIYGTAIFRAVAQRQTDPVRRHEMETLSLLEDRTRAIAEPVMEARGLPMTGLAGNAEEAAATLAERPLADFLQWLDQVTSEFLGVYRQLVTLSDEGEQRDIATAYVAHEAAIASYIRRVDGRETGDPLEAVAALPHMAGAVHV
jgi:hypothetical protein